MIQKPICIGLSIEKICVTAFSAHQVNVHRVPYPCYACASAPIANVLRAGIFTCRIGPKFDEACIAFVRADWLALSMSGPNVNTDNDSKNNCMTVASFLIGEGSQRGQQLFAMKRPGVATRASRSSEVSDNPENIASNRNAAQYIFACKKMRDAISTCPICKFLDNLLCHAQSSAHMIYMND
jgi:hypothetical protein